MMNRQFILMICCYIIFFRSTSYNNNYNNGIVGVVEASSSSFGQDTTDPNADDDIIFISNLIDWLKENGAYINDDVEVRQIPTVTTSTSNNNNKYKLSGLFAKSNISKGSIICTIPWELIIKPNKYSKLQQGSYCATVSVVYDSLTKLPQLQTPYEKYLSTRLSRSYLPQFWSIDGRRLLEDLILLARSDGGKLIKKIKLKKKKKRDDWVTLYLKDCLNINLDRSSSIDDENNNDHDHDGDDDDDDKTTTTTTTTDDDYDYELIQEYLNDEHLLNAISIVHTRGEGPALEHLVPFHDINNHGNGLKWNVDISDPRLIIKKQQNNKDNKHYQLFARRDINAGEQLMHSYNQCKWCTTQYTNPFDESKFFLTTQILFWYGFVEDYPQRWIIPHVRLFFDIDIKTTITGSKHNDEDEEDISPKSNGEDDDDNNDDDKLIEESLDVNFIVPPTNRSISYLVETIQILNKFKRKYLDNKDTTKTKTSKLRRIPENELDVIRQYHSSMLIAFKTALRKGRRQQQQHSSSSSSWMNDDKVWSLDQNEWYWEEYDQIGKWYWEEREIDIDIDGHDGGIDDRFEL